MRLSYSISLLLLLLVTENTFASETHELRVRGLVNYRCYPGASAKTGEKVKDERTGQDCDNETYKKALIDRVVSIKITDEPDPENSKDLIGSWQETVEFKGRRYTAVITLSKWLPAQRYELRVVGKDDEPTARSSAMFVEFKRINDLNPLTIDYSSVGKKEEVSFQVKVESTGKKLAAKK